MKKFLLPFLAIFTTLSLTSCEKVSQVKSEEVKKEVPQNQEKIQKEIPQNEEKIQKIQKEIKETKETWSGTGAS